MGNILAEIHRISGCWVRSSVSARCAATESDRSRLFLAHTVALLNPSPGTCAPRYRGFMLKTITARRFPAEPQYQFRHYQNYTPQELGAL